MVARSNATWPLVQIEIPIRLRPLNAALRSHVFTNRRHAKEQRQLVAMFLGGHVPILRDATARGARFAVLVTRYAPRQLDAHDGLPGACKHVVDEIAAAIGLDDRDPRIAWSYAQRPAVARPRGVPGAYAVGIEIAEVLA